VETREQRGLVIAAKSKITRSGDVWLVPSQTESGDKYTVIPGLKCSCPDNGIRQVKCKHMFAVEYVMERKITQDGTVTETETLKVTKVTRKTYPQNWTAYNAAQSEEKTRFGVLLADPCTDEAKDAADARYRAAVCSGATRRPFSRR